MMLCPCPPPGVPLFPYFFFSLVSTKFQADRDIMSRLGFDLLSHLEAMRSNDMAIRNIDIHECTQASSAALRVWEDSNFPYRWHQTVGVTGQE